MVSETGSLVLQEQNYSILALSSVLLRYLIDVYIVLVEMARYWVLCWWPR